MSGEELVAWRGVAHYAVPGDSITRCGKRAPVGVPLHEHPETLPICAMCKWTMRGSSTTPKRGDRRTRDR